MSIINNVIRQTILSWQRAVRLIFPLLRRGSVRAACRGSGRTPKALVRRARAPRMDTTNPTSVWEETGRLGRGGANTVYRAINKDTGDEAAAKVHSDIESFRRELQTLRSINGYRQQHDPRRQDFVVNLKGADEQGPRGPTIYLEIADGGSLDQLLLEAAHGMEETDVKRWTKKMLEILLYLHLDRRNQLWLAAEDGCEGQPASGKPAKMFGLF